MINNILNWFAFVAFGLDILTTAYGVSTIFDKPLYISGILGMIATFFLSLILFIGIRLQKTLPDKIDNHIIKIKKGSGYIFIVLFILLDFITSAIGFRELIGVEKHWLAIIFEYVVFPLGCTAGTFYLTFLFENSLSKLIDLNSQIDAK